MPSLGEFADTGGMPDSSIRSANAVQMAQARWRLPVLLALLTTIPAFYIELIDQLPTPVAVALYLTAALLLGLSVADSARHTPKPLRHAVQRKADVLLAAGLLAAALLPPSGEHDAALALRLVVAMLTLGRMVWLVQPWLTRGSLGNLLLLALFVLSLCGAGFWALEPQVQTLGQGIWLAFTTAATVGYGDVVPRTPAGKIFSVFVVLLGYAVLSLVTAAIAAFWVENTERRIERDILQNLHREMQALRHELRTLREQVARHPAASPPAPSVAPEVAAAPAERPPPAV